MFNDQTETVLKQVCLQKNPSVSASHKTNNKQQQLIVKYRVPLGAYRSHCTQRMLQCHSPAEVCLNFSLFFFLHFHGLKRRPRLANLLRRRMGGVCVPGTRESERMAASRSTSSAPHTNKHTALGLKSVNLPL